MMTSGDTKKRIMLDPGVIKKFGTLLTEIYEKRGEKPSPDSLTQAKSFALAFEYIHVSMLKTMREPTIDKIVKNMAGHLFLDSIAQIDSLQKVQLTNRGRIILEDINEGIGRVQAIKNALEKHILEQDLYLTADSQFTHLISKLNEIARELYHINENSKMLLKDDRFHPILSSTTNAINYLQTNADETKAVLHVMNILKTWERAGMEKDVINMLTEMINITPG